MIKVLILGGSGILSTDVLKACLQRGMDVTCITRGTRDHRIPDGIKIVHGNVSNLEPVLKELSEHYNAVLDFLSFTVVELKYKIETLASRCDQYFFVSSSVAYSFEDPIITENTKLGNEFWDYGSNKVACERFLRNNHERYGIKYTIIRPYITYGVTRIPFGIIPVSGEYWTLANRITYGKPVLLWDDGKAKCTLTNTEDFARGFVDLIHNDKAYNEAFHITSDEVLTWRDVLNELSANLDKKPIVISRTTAELIELLPEYKGVLNGDKARDRIFDNTKIKNAAPTFKNLIPFSDGIAKTVKHYMEFPIEQTMNYEWDGRIDWAISKLVGEDNNYNLKFSPLNGKWKVIDKIDYMKGRYPAFGKMMRKIQFCFSMPGKIIRRIRRKYISMKLSPQEKRYAELKKSLYYLGENCVIGNCNFGEDKYLISIGNNVHIMDGVRFYNYRPTAEHYEHVFSDNPQGYLRDIGIVDIRENTFICSNVIIYPGVTIGHNSLVLEGSVVINDIPDNCVVCGNPAAIKGRTDEWYNKICDLNEQYPWFEKQITHEQAIKERQEYFFGGGK